MDKDYYGSRAGDFKPGDRVEIHPATDLWMSGVRFGDVGRIGREYVQVKFDRLERVRRVKANLLRRVDI